MVNRARLVDLLIHEAQSFSTYEEKRNLSIKHTAYRKRVRPTQAVYYPSIAKGLKVDEAVMLGKRNNEKAGKAELNSNET